MIKKDTIITINSRKFDGKIHRSWKAKFLEQQNSLLTFVGEFEEEVSHKHLGVIRRGTISYEYYWLDRCYSIFRFHEPEGELRNFYCNINLPPTLENNVLDYIDLDIDILVWKNFEIKILDLEEFEAHAAKYNYSEVLKNNAKNNLIQILKLIENRSFPFNIKL